MLSVYLCLKVITISGFNFTKKWCFWHCPDQDFNSRPDKNTIFPSVLLSICLSFHVLAWHPVCLLDKKRNWSWHCQEKVLASLKQWLIESLFDTEDRFTDIQMDTNGRTNRQTDRQTENWTDIQTKWWINRQINSQIVRLLDTDRLMHRWKVGKMTDWQTDRRTVRQSESQTVRQVR
jgi:hypothetical protein